eukprot:CAMPEP_0201740972 /NCGR_PEP_ID=MMETSP0593-20130828/46573_1 /ASSEMBLY_ACC=CAM_ASM_000672 /TAXON_ID=267983 /ORGANISM="Skeletonema japonicum, Strain CCMP2506" /LENGTH=99 /DNA_ID=CAMNT_0048235293 /DNA_START=421 /DNA_END=721 /DNA_ORIENTATION=-
MGAVRWAALVSRDDVVSRLRANGGARKKPSRFVVDGELLWERLKNEVNDLGDDRLTPKAAMTAAVKADVWGDAQGLFLFSGELEGTPSLRKDIRDASLV